MSAKGNGAASIAKDAYGTPFHMVTRLIEVWPEFEELCKGDGDIIEPTAGDGAILRVLGLHVPAPRLHAVELRAECEPTLRSLGIGSVTMGDTLVIPPRPSALTMTNPPYSSFDQIARRYRPTSRHLGLLGRASWLFGAKERSALVKAIGMPDCYGFPERPTFVRVEYRNEDGKLLASGGTDSVGAVWHIWSDPLVRGKAPRQVGKVVMLRLPTDEEVAAHVPPRRVITVSQAEWLTKKKRSKAISDVMYVA